MKFDVIIIGGGAAGLMCAIEAGKRGRSVVVLEHAERLGKKILISGGGRCNFTNLNAGPEHFLSDNPHFCKSALARFSPADFLALVNQHGIAWHEKKLGQLFCDTSSREIVGLLQKEAAAARVAIRLNSRVTEVRRPAHFQVQVNGEWLESNALVIATGGLSFPKIGATDLGHRLAQQFGLKLTPLRPGLVPLTIDGTDEAPGSLAFGELSGLSVDVIARCHEASFRENILFTHRGLSGPAILQISNYAPPGTGFTLDLLPGQDAEDWLADRRQSGKELKTVLSQVWPARFAEAWCAAGIASRPMHRYSREELTALGQRLKHWELRVAGTEGYAKAEVTLGGVDTTELSSKTMETRAVPGLFFVGEVIDVTGWLGGFNFQWAWASGFAAGQAI